MKRYTVTELESYIRSIDAGQYTRTRNHIGGSTRLSEYISRGAISLPKVKELLLEKNSVSSAYKLINELSWREYWQIVWQVRGNEIFDYFRPLPKKPRQGIPIAVLEAKTGIDALDTGIRQLYETGYIDNHMRMWLAGLVCNIAQCDWIIGAQWMHSHLVDGDYASNHLSWQWVAGSYTGRPYTPQQENINKYTSSSQRGSYLDKSYQELNTLGIPPELQQIQPALPELNMVLPEQTITVDELLESDTVYLYSPWTLDSRWKADNQGLRVLLLDTDMFSEGSFSQNVIDGIAYFAGQIPDLKILPTTPDKIVQYSGAMYRKQYPGIADWPGQVDAAEKLFPNVPEKFYPSFSAFWKEASKNRPTD